MWSELIRGAQHTKWEEKPNGSVAQLRESSKKFTVDFETDSPIDISLSDLESMKKVTVDMKVLTNHEHVTFVSGVIKQQVTVADSYAVAKVILWEENTGRI